MEMLEEDMIFIIVGDDANKADPLPNVKEEIENVEDENVDQNESAVVKKEIDSEEMNHLLETAEKYGEMMSVEFIKAENESAGQSPADDDMCSEYLEEFSSSDEEFLITIAKKKKQRRDPPQPIDENIINHPRRRRMLTAKERKSYVRDLKKEDPSLRSNEELLIEAVAEKMRSTKPPPPPKDFLKIEKLENSKSFMCATCDQAFQTVPEATRHYQQQHGERYLTCLACGVTFRDATNLYKHEKRCVAPDALVVLKARARVVVPKSRDRPFLPPPGSRVKRKPPVQLPHPKRFSCSYCPARFTAKLALLGHENMHRGERPYRCQHCLAPYASYSALNRHRLTHSEEANICGDCGRSFTTKYTLRAHQETHNPVRKYACKECPKRFAQNCALLLHVRRQHLNLPPPCACQLCPKRFGRNSVLKIHMKKEHGMELITRNMFIKSMSKLTQMELDEAKVVLKSEVEAFPEIYISNDDNLDIPNIANQPITITKERIQKNKTGNMKPEESGQSDKGRCDDNDTDDTNNDNDDSEIDNDNDGSEIDNDNDGSEIDNDNDGSEIENDDSDIDNDPPPQDNADETNEMKCEPENGANQVIVDISDTNMSSSVVRFVRKLQIDATAENRTVKIILMDQGNILHLVESESDADKLMEYVQEDDDEEVQNMAIVSNYAGEQIEEEAAYCVYYEEANQNKSDSDNNDENAGDTVCHNDDESQDKTNFERKPNVSIEGPRDYILETRIEDDDSSGTDNMSQKGNLIIDEPPPKSVEDQLEDIHTDSSPSEDMGQSNIDSEKEEPVRATNVNTDKSRSKPNKNKTAKLHVGKEIEHDNSVSDAQADSRKTRKGAAPKF